MTDQEARDEREALAQKLREVYMTTPATRGGSSAKWLAVADAALAHQPRKHPEPEWEYSAGYEDDSPAGRKWFALDSEYWIREAAESVAARYEDPQVKLIRRTKPGPWEPVTIHTDSSGEEQR